MSKPDATKPNPGSDAALEAGCTCPMMDNCRGRGYLGQPGVFVIDGGCPVHAKNWPDAAADFIADDRNDDTFSIQRLHVS